jgi:hypothetical protein
MTRRPPDGSSPRHAAGWTRDVEPAKPRGRRALPAAQLGALDRWQERAVTTGTVAGVLLGVGATWWLTLGLGAASVRVPESDTLELMWGSPGLLILADVNARADRRSALGVGMACARRSLDAPVRGAGRGILDAAALRVLRRAYRARARDGRHRRAPGTTSGSTARDVSQSMPAPNSPPPGGGTAAGGIRSGRVISVPTSTCTNASSALPKCQPSTSFERPQAHRDHQPLRLRHRPR